MSPPTNQDHVWQNRAEMALASATSLGRIVTYAEMAMRLIFRHRNAFIN